MMGPRFLTYPLLAAALLFSAHIELSSPAKALSPRETLLLYDVGDRIFFEHNSAALRPNAIEFIRRAADWLRRHPEYQILIEGHTDSRQPKEYNLELGCRRAVAAREGLIERGIAPDRLGTISYGAERPAVLGDNEAA